MTIGQEQLMKMKVELKSKVEVEERSDNSSLPLQLHTSTKSFGWKIIEFAFNLWLAAVVGICAWIAIFG